MEATDILMSEHRVIERILAVLNKAADRLERGESVRMGFFVETTDFIGGFADGCHHRKEEGVLFPTMEDFGVPVEGGPIGAMLDEHEQSRIFTKGMREAALQVEAGDSNAIPTLIQNARGYAALLQQHILKEDTILFPLADKFIPADDQDEVLDGFEHVEHEETGEGIHEKYLALADKLEKEMGLD
ncbi:MAG: hemerythrin domain-containing protein [Anaerolineaceae bacterium]|nr:hemerythrin domain-containing protein [Anaerolineaceae bacterium]